MSKKKLNKLNPFKKNWSKIDESQSIQTFEFIENLTLFKFLQCINSKNTKDIEKGLYSIIKTIRDEKEREDQPEQPILNYKNEQISLLFDYLRQSNQTTELFQIWDQCVDKPEIYANIHSMLMELFAIILTINDDPSLPTLTKYISDNILNNRFIEIHNLVIKFQESGRPMIINAFRLLAAITGLSLKNARHIQSNFLFTDTGFHKSMTDVSTFGPYSGSRPFVLRFMLSFLKHQNPQLTEFILDNENLLPKYCKTLQYDHHNIVLDLIESLQEYVLQSKAISKKIKCKFFNSSFLSKLGMVFSKEDIGDDARDQIYQFLVTLCCSPQTGITSTVDQQKWTWFRLDDQACFENRAIVSLISELNPISYQTHQMLFIKIINSCPDLFTSYLRKLGHFETTLSLNWLNKTTMLIKTLLAPVPKKPHLNVVTNEKLIEPIPSSPMVLINLLVPPQINSEKPSGLFQFPLVTYNQLLVLQLCLKRVNTVMKDLLEFRQDLFNSINSKGTQNSLYYSLEDIDQFIGDLKKGLMERLPNFNYFKENFKMFKQNATTYNQYLSILSEYLRYLPIPNQITLKMIDYTMIQQSPYTQKLFIQLMSHSKTINSITSLLSKDTGSDAPSILSMIIQLYYQVTRNNAIDLKEMFYQLLLRVFTINNIFAGVDQEIDIWLDYLVQEQDESIAMELIQFLETLISNSNKDKFQLVDTCQLTSKQLFKNIQEISTSPILVSSIQYLYNQQQSTTDNIQQYLSKVYSTISSNTVSSSTVLFLFYYLSDKSQDIYEISLDSLKSFKISSKNFSSEIQSTLKLIYFQTFGSVDKFDKLNKSIALSFVGGEDELNCISVFRSSSLLVSLNRFLLVSDIVLISHPLRSYILSTISQHSNSRKLSNLIPLILSLIKFEFQKSSSADNIDFYFDVLDLVLVQLLQLKNTQQSCKLISMILYNDFLQSQYLVNDRITLLLLLLVIRILNHQNPIHITILNKITDLIFNNQNINNNIRNQSSQLLLPFLDVESTLQYYTKTFTNIESIQCQPNQFLQSIQNLINNSKITLNSIPVPTYLAELLHFNICKPQSNLVKISITSNTNIVNSTDIKKQIFNNLIELAMSSPSSEIFYKCILEFLLMDLCCPLYMNFSCLNQLYYHHHQFIKNLLSGKIDNPYQVPIITLLFRSFDNFHELFGTGTMLSTIKDINQLVPLLYTIQQYQKQPSPCDSILQSTFIELVSKTFSKTLKPVYYETASELCSVLSKYIDLEKYIDSPSNYIIYQSLTEIDQNLTKKVIRQLVNNFITSLESSMKSNRDLFRFNIQFLDKYLKMNDNEDLLESLVKKSCEYLEDIEILEFLDKLLEHVNSYYYLLGVFKKLLDSSYIMNVIEDYHSVQLNYSRFLILNILLKIYSKNSKFCTINSNNKLVSVYFKSYQATTHPNDLVLYRIIYHHEKSGINILEDSNYLWGLHYNQSSNIHHLLKTNTLLQDGHLQRSISSFPVDLLPFSTDPNEEDSDDNMQVDSTTENHKDDKVEIDYTSKELVVKPVVEFPYDPSFLLRLFLIILQDKDLNSNAFYFNGPLVYSIRSLSSQSVGIRKLGYMILMKFIKLVQDEWSKSKVKLVQLKFLKVLKQMVFEKNQLIPNVFTLFISNSIRLLGWKKDPNRDAIIAFFKGTPLLSMTSIPYLNSNLLKLSNRNLVGWLYDGVLEALPNQNTEYLIRRSNALPMFMGLFDSYLSTPKVKLTILEILLKLSSSASSIVLVKQGIITWISYLIVNPSLQVQYIQMIYRILEQLLHTISPSSSEFNQFNLITQVSWDLIMKLNWNTSREFKDIIKSFLKCLSTILSNFNSNFKVTTTSLNTLIEKYQSINDTSHQNELLPIVLEIIITLKHDNQSPHIVQWFIEKQIQYLTTSTSSSSTNLIKNTLKWLQDLQIQQSSSSMKSDITSSSTQSIVNYLFFINNQYISKQSTLSRIHLINCLAIIYNNNSKVSKDLTTKFNSLLSKLPSPLDPNISIIDDYLSVLQYCQSNM
ncbi:hypothetical protein DLAC_11007 [Tieghemostelium lacteum]|uniref:Nucleolar pre-ribosomal-associated protein 1 C-terminal domain-containing protein n=1 Tax=Tieghemostelium lacteum TaxID=361077 RepID=A0A151Z2Y7_TIELA|nr:hypothetical protein DLAC_11007 [Tieghemostelium lacteum]|eukprot:KYQ88311.1 hypothetical protein DLAC_11007 [Tieghemostelium lacteum]